MAKAITSIGTFSNTEKVIRQSLSRMFDDCITGTASAGSTTTLTMSSMTPPHFYDSGDNFFNKDDYEVYINAGTNIGKSYVATDWVNSTHVLTFAPTASSSMGSTSVPELHKIFYVAELRDAINRAIDFYASRYLLDLKDETTIHLTRTARNDNSSSYIYTYEYALPTDCLYLWRVTTEDAVGGVKITGTLSDDLTLGEKVTGDSSGATGLVSYTDATGGYIRIREESGTFTTDDTITGATSEETVTSITDIDRTEQAGDGKFPPENVLDPRDWRILKPYAPKIKLMEGYYTVVEDLRLRLEYQGIQDNVTADTDTIMLPTHEFLEVAATFLPFNKIESNNFTAKFNSCMRTRDKVEARPPSVPYANARKCW
jgi:hypothetical protein